ncbi:hypothetical protein [Pelagicoccus sp. SDUM812003]|uniref:hypothetical protein n=1 Tax=Pelagicoccus sp. SDUM812003 TaxID=3041267 RepID=UPI00280FBE5F|nr:hypothetical protein [Pelagicoccus sp. SDUM812003]MDQ8204500.1 hypothetical protein [Pelagicoccus sp. SDUM812003]
MSAARSNTWQNAVDKHFARARRQEKESGDRFAPNVDLPLSHVKVYETLTITEVDPQAEQTAELDQPVDLLQVDPSAPLIGGPAVGVILRYEQAWRMKGLSLGRLLHSLSLAPGEVTQVAMVDWERGTRAGTSEDVDEAEDASKSASRDRMSHEVTQAVESEVTAGGSSTLSSNTQVDGGIGGVLGFLGGSASASANSGIATSANWSTGSRNASADSLQKIREKTAQHAANTRSRKATLVQEVSETQTEQFKTRVVANYNHMHSLNMQYFEVLQVYELATRPVKAERCLFLPMQVMTFDDETVRDFSKPLSKAAFAMGMPVLAEAILHFGLTQEQSEKQIESHLTKVSLAKRSIQASTTNLERAKGNVSRLETELPRSQRTLDDANTKLSELLQELDTIERRQVELRSEKDQLAKSQRETRKSKQQLDRSIQKALDEVNRFRIPGMQTFHSISEVESFFENSAFSGIAGSIRPTLAKVRAEEAAIETQMAKNKSLELAITNAQAALVAQSANLKTAAQSARRTLTAAETVHSKVKSRLIAEKKAVTTAREQLVAAKETFEEAQRLHAAAIAGSETKSEDLKSRLNARKLEFNQAIWAQFDPSSVEAILAGRGHQGFSLIDTVNPKPMAIIGTYVGFRWGFPDDKAGVAAEKEFSKRYLDDFSDAALDTHVLPTGGVFAEAVLGRANAAEKLDITRYWHWDKDTIPIQPTAIRKLTQQRHAARAQANPGALGDPVVRTEALPTAPPGPGHEMANVIAASAFRDMSGSGVIKDLLEAGQKAAKDGSANAQELAHKNISEYIDHIEQLLPEVTNLIGSGKLDPSTMGALNNALGEGGAINPEALLGLASEAGLMAL